MWDVSGLEERLRSDFMIDIPLQKMLDDDDKLYEEKLRDIISESVVWQVVLFAGAGVIVGGTIAKFVVLAFSVQRLKLFFGIWVLILGVTSLPIL